MTAEQLISILRTFPPQTEVVVPVGPGYSHAQCVRPISLTSSKGPDANIGSTLSVEFALAEPESTESKQCLIVQ